MPTNPKAAKKAEAVSTDAKNAAAAGSQKQAPQKAQEDAQNKAKTNANSASFAGNKNKFGYGGTANTTDADKDDGEQVEDRSTCVIA